LFNKKKTVWNFSNPSLDSIFFILSAQQKQAETSVKSPPAPIDVVKIIFHNALIYHRKLFFQVPDEKIFLFYLLSAVPDKGR